MGDFVTVEDLATALRETVDNATAEQAIADAESAVRSSCGWNLTEETVTGAVVQPVGDMLFLPTLRLTALAVTEAGSALVDGTGYGWTSGGTVVRLSGRWSTTWGAVVVTYTHGYPTAAPELQPARTAARSYAIRQYQNAAQMRSESVGAVSDVYAIPATGVPIGVDLSYSEQSLLAPLRLMVLA